MIDTLRGAIENILIQVQDIHCDTHGMSPTMHANEGCGLCIAHGILMDELKKSDEHVCPPCPTCSRRAEQAKDMTWEQPGDPPEIFDQDDHFLATGELPGCRPKLAPLPLTKYACSTCRDTKSVVVAAGRDGCLGAHRVKCPDCDTDEALAWHQLFNRANRSSVEHYEGCLVKDHEHALSECLVQEDLDINRTPWEKK